MNITISEARSFINNGVDRILRYYYVHTFTFICKLQLSFNTYIHMIQTSARPNNNNVLFDLMLLTFHKEEHTHYNITHISLCACLCCDALMCSAGLAFVFYVIA